jgi:penicillin-binding protein 1C
MGQRLKPFLYALALEKGWTAATLINDSPLASPVGTGLHTYHNYSRLNYGLLRLRDALGNSLNVPAVRTVQFTGIEELLKRLRYLGFRSLTQHPDHYGEGLALGNGEVKLFELVQAYAALAGKGFFRPLVMVAEEAKAPESARRVFSEEVSSLIANILSDPESRRLEFGNGNLLRFPAQTAVKTGTSSDYRDAWAVGFSHRYTVGVWMGNLDQKPMREVTGSTGPALVLRAVFAELNRHEEAKPLYLSPRLRGVKICRISGQLATPDCPIMNEWFERDNIPVRLCTVHHQSSEDKMEEKILAAGLNQNDNALRLLQPTHGLQLAMDPRIPDELEAFTFTLPEDLRAVKVDWVVDGNVVGSTSDSTNKFPWHLSRGTHVTLAKVWLDGVTDPLKTEAVTFHVK